MASSYLSESNRARRRSRHFGLTIGRGREFADWQPFHVGELSVEARRAIVKMVRQLDKAEHRNFDKWIGRTPDRAKRTMVCHELTMNFINYLAMMSSVEMPFENPHQAQVSDIFYIPWERKRLQ